MRRSLQFVLFGLNVAFWVIGSAMLGIGIWMAVDEDNFLTVGFATGTAKNQVIWPAAILISAGALLFIVSFFGCIGAAMADRNACLLWVYLVSISIIIVLEIVAIVLVAISWTSIDDAGLAAVMYKDVRNNYVNETSTDETSYLWNKMQQIWKCCGSYNYTDYFGSNYDNDNIDQIKVPYTCCENPLDIKQRLECQKGNEDYIHLQGCYDACVENVNHNAPVVIGVTSAFVALHITGLVIACVLVIMKRRDKYEEYNNVPTVVA